MTAPLSRLRDRMAAIADGDGDLTQRVDEAGGDEIAEPGRAFNRFAGEIGRAVSGAAAGAEQMGASIREISESASGAVRVADHAVLASAAAQTTLAALADASEGYLHPGCTPPAATPGAAVAAGSGAGPGARR